MRCPDCGIKIETLHCERCESEAARYEQEMQNLVEKYSLVRGAPGSEETQASLEFALARLRQRLHEEQFQGTVEYNVRDLMYHPRWWYIPYQWIGCSGFVVDIDTGYVNWLGSAQSLDLCFWGHDRGLFHDTVDFSFAPDTSIELAGRLLRRFKREPLPSTTSENEDLVWYGKAEIDAALSENFPTFRRHFVWYALPELRDACENEGLRFTSILSQIA
jgi:hypothetical protein